MTAPTTRQITEAAARLRFFSEIANLEAMRDAISTGRPRDASDELNLLIRDWIIDGLIAFEPVIANLSKRAAAAEALEAAQEMEDA